LIAFETLYIVVLYKFEILLFVDYLSERTISTWINQLEKARLIERYQLSYDEVAHTYLQPYDPGSKRIIINKNDY